MIHCAVAVDLWRSGEESSIRRTYEVEVPTQAPSAPDAIGKLVAAIYPAAIEVSRAAEAVTFEHAEGRIVAGFIRPATEDVRRGAPTDQEELFAA